MDINTEFETNVKNPYIDTILDNDIMLHPNQMNNQIYLNLKNNLINKLKGKCYRDYGYIVTIYKILHYENGYISADNNLCAAKYKIKFSCRLCIPIKNQEIICKIDRMTKKLISVVNGPITIIITDNRINKDIFFVDLNSNFRYKNIEASKSELLKPGMYVKILITSLAFHHTDENIKALGILMNIATKDEMKMFDDNDNFNNGKKQADNLDNLEADINIQLDKDDVQDNMKLIDYDDYIKNK